MNNAETTAMNRVTSAEMRANAALEKAKEEVSQRLADAETEMCIRDRTGWAAPSWAVRANF